jgi:hypothetical protein
MSAFHHHLRALQAELFNGPGPRGYVRCIVSGGQTGADRAALDAARAVGLPHGGWVPRGRWAEDGPLDERYGVHETDTGDLTVRTAWNVRDSDATVILSHGPLRSGSALTRRLARQANKPVLHLNLNRLNDAAAVKRLWAWLEEHRPAVLNVAGPRASNDPDLYAAVYRLLVRVFASPAGAGTPQRR